jgi:hypothetical protein
MPKELDKTALYSLTKCEGGVKITASIQENSIFLLILQLSTD